MVGNYTRVIIFTFLLTLTGCDTDILNLNVKKDDTISDRYIYDFWEIFKSGNISKIANYYANDIILLPRSVLTFKVLGISEQGYSKDAKMYTREEIVIAYRNLQRELGGKESWQYLFSERNMKVEQETLELLSVKNTDIRVKSYIRSNFFFNFFKIDDDDIVFVVRPLKSKVRDKLIFVFSRETQKIIAQTIILTFLGSHYFEGFLAEPK